VIDDDGQGFDVGETRDGGLGLIGMRERIELIDGRLTVESSSSGGTSVVAEVPLT
jgi:two-component system sensor histidine kinase DegS